MCAWSRIYEISLANDADALSRREGRHLRSTLVRTPKCALHGGQKNDRKGKAAQPREGIACLAVQRLHAQKRVRMPKERSTSPVPPPPVVEPVKEPSPRIELAGGTLEFGPDDPSFPLNCIAKGPALEKAMTRQWHTFTIEAYTIDSKRQTVGGELFIVSFRGASFVSHSVIDNGDGSYTIRYRAAVSGLYQLSINLSGHGIKGSPFNVQVLSRAPDHTKCKVKGPGLSASVAREPTSFEIEFVDCFGQVTHAEDLDVWVEWFSDPTPPVKVKPIDETKDPKHKGKAGHVEEALLDVPVKGKKGARPPEPAKPAEPEPEKKPEKGKGRASSPPPVNSDQATGAPPKALPVAEAAPPSDGSPKGTDGVPPLPKGKMAGMSWSARGANRPLRSYRLDASERQGHMTLWARRLQTEGVSQAKPLSVALTARNTARQSSPGRKGQHENPQGPSYAHELAADAKGVAFAFGGVDPGTLHAGGKAVKSHMVHYSIGKAGNYLLHIGLRQQGQILLGSPFHLSISAGQAHPAWTKVQIDGLTLPFQKETVIAPDGPRLPPSSGANRWAYTAVTIGRWGGGEGGHRGRERPNG